MDPGLVEDLRCKFCVDDDVKTEKDTTLDRCSKCKSVWWCSAKCHEERLQEEADFCNEVAANREIIERLIVTLQDSGVVSDDYQEVQRYFEEHDGTLTDEVSEYLNARCILAEIYWEVAYSCERKHMWEEALFQSLKLMKVDPGYDSSVRIRVPFILLYLNRDDEAYAFIRYWLKEDNHGQSRPYPIEPGCRYLDILKESISSEEQDVYLPYLVALAIIKMRTIAHHDAISRSIDLAFEQPGGKQILEVRSVVQETLMDGNINITAQREQLNRIVDRINGEQLIHGDIDEPLMTVALAHCHIISETMDYFELDEMLEELYGCPERMKVALGSSLRCFHRVPCASFMLENLLNGEADATRKRKADSGFKPVAKR